MIQNVDEIVPEIAEGVRDGNGTVYAHKLLDVFPKCDVRVGLVRLEPGASIGPHSHHGEEDFTTYSVAVLRR